MFKYTLGYILERAIFNYKVGYEKRFYPRRHPLTPEECARLKYLIRTRLKTEDYRCRMPDARCYMRRQTTKDGWHLTPVYRLRLRTGIVRIPLQIGSGKNKLFVFSRKQKVWR